MENKVIFWFRRDLRLQDNAGLYHALKSGFSVKPVFIFDKEILDKLEVNDRRVVFIHSCLQKLKAELKGLGSDLEIFTGVPADVFQKIVYENTIKAIYSNRDYEPLAILRDEKIKKICVENKIEFLQFKDQCIFEKGEIAKLDGGPYTVFTPYAKRWKEKFTGFYCKAYPTEKYAENFLQFTSGYFPDLKELGFEIQPLEFPTQKIRKQILQHYEALRNFPAEETSRISVHLRFGTLSIREALRKGIPISEKWVDELIWRDFYMQLLAEFPYVVERSFKSGYDRIPWKNDESEFDRWCRGESGYPIVDAGMRELNQTGFMHNRVRMVVASFLSKHLLIDWRWGEAYFAQKLLDYELSSNNGGWQWAAGCGADAAPYFRIFNPYTQASRFDPQNEYIRKWVPEFESKEYFKPVVDHAFARKRCLETYSIALNSQRM